MEKIHLGAQGHGEDACLMGSTSNEKKQYTGAFGYANWLAFSEAIPSSSKRECLVYSDALLTGEVVTDLGPYQFFNLVPTHCADTIKPSATLSYSIHVEYTLPELNKTDQSAYCGGTLADELTALASLLCGVRLRAGAVTRRYDSGDPIGRPVWWSDRPEPILNVGVRGNILPKIRGKHSIMPIQRIKHYPRLSPAESVALVRSARLYQDALWLAESEPHLSWLMLVSAVESVAVQWRSSNMSSLERLRDFKPDLVDYLDSTGVEGLSERIAKEFSHLTKSTATFVDFVMSHLPQPPEKRPAEWAQIEWTEDSLRKALKTIYEYRSKALHTGVPFPVPMCEPPIDFKQWDAPAEKPHASATSAYGGTWLAEDTPMLLQTFEYIARHAINAWWTSPP